MLENKLRYKKSSRNAREPKGIDMKLTNWSKSILFIFIIYLEEYEKKFIFLVNKAYSKELKTKSNCFFVIMNCIIGTIPKQKGVIF